MRNGKGAIMKREILLGETVITVDRGSIHFSGSPPPNIAWIDVYTDSVVIAMFTNSVDHITMEHPNSVHPTTWIVQETLNCHKAPYGVDENSERKILWTNPNKET